MSISQVTGRQAARALLLVVAFSSLGSTCATDGYEPPPDTPARVYLNLTYKPSCGFETSEYDATCLGAISLTARNNVEDQNVCGVIAPPDDLDALINSGFAELALGTLSDRGMTTFEIRGLHTRGLEPGDDVCSNPDDKGRWLLWGESRPVDLAALRDPDATDLTVNIPVDCRDCVGGCANFGNDICPLDPTSFCVPGTLDLGCDLNCANDGACFEEQLSCLIPEPTDEMPDPVGRCEVSADGIGALCSACTSDADCQVEQGYNCVARLGADTGICAPRCPDNRFDNRCVAGTRCTRVGNDIWPIDRMPGSEQDGGPVDAGNFYDAGHTASDGGIIDAADDAGDSAPGDAGPDAGAMDAGSADVLDAGLVDAAAPVAGDGGIADVLDAG